MSTRPSGSTRRALPTTPQWLTATAWQGGGLVVDRLERIGPGVYRTTRPIPVHGDWKALIRLHDGRSLTAVPIYLPDDPAIPAPRRRRAGRFQRTFVSDQQDPPARGERVVARRDGGRLRVVLAIALAILAVLAAGLHRLAATTPDAPQPGPRRARRPLRLRSRRTAPLPAEPPGSRLD